MTKPKRVQFTRNIVLPSGTIYVGRPTIYGNPFSHLPHAKAKEFVETVEEAVEQFRLHCGPGGRYAIDPADIRRLRGHDLACWCPIGKPCHADVLLDWANT